MLIRERLLKIYIERPGLVVKPGFFSKGLIRAATLDLLYEITEYEYMKGEASVPVSFAPESEGLIICLHGE